MPKMERRSAELSKKNCPPKETVHVFTENGNAIALMEAQELKQQRIAQRASRWPKASL